MRWPFSEWGVTAVLSGHDHSFERFVIPPPLDEVAADASDGGASRNSSVVYIVNGLGGVNFYPFHDASKRPPAEESAFRFTGRPGVQLIEADKESIVFKLMVNMPDNSTKTLDCYGEKYTPS